MLFVGIDVASRKHYAAITSSHGDILTKPFTILNDLEGFKKLRDEKYAKKTAEGKHHNSAIFSAAKI
jgi:hypothetical protein